MNTTNIVRSFAMLVIAAAFGLISPTSLSAHCDTMDGPVVRAARNALQGGNVNLVLIWVQKSDEEEIKAAFASALAVRKLSPEAKNLADLYFFETVVRVHRMGEGAPYTGLKPAGTPIEPGIAMADNAVEKSSTDSLLQHFSKALRQHVRAAFDEVTRSKNYSSDDVESGRRFVRAYVEFIHYVEAVETVVAGTSGGHLHESERTGIRKAGP